MNRYIFKVLFIDVGECHSVVTYRYTRYSNWPFVSMGEFHSGYL